MIDIEFYVKQVSQASNGIAAFAVAQHLVLRRGSGILVASSRAKGSQPA